MKSAVKKWGNGAGIRIPTRVMETISLKVGDIVDVHAEAGRIVIRLRREKVSDINELIKAITVDNLHQPADLGPAVGKEAW
jgi:antitoxin MazE